jgi:hypothetical protein
MTKLHRILVAGGCAALLILGAGKVQAQGRGGNFAQWRQDRLDNLREQLEIKDDQEWSAIQPKIEKVMDAQRDFLGMAMSGMRPRRPRNEDNNNSSDTQRRPRGGMFGEPSPSLEALRKAVDEKAPKEEIKAKIAAVHAEYKQKHAALEAAQEDLRGVLTSRQEAVATVNGLLE